MILSIIFKQRKGRHYQTQIRNNKIEQDDHRIVQEGMEFTYHEQSNSTIIQAMEFTHHEQSNSKYFYITTFGSFSVDIHISWRITTNSYSVSLIQWLNNTHIVPKETILT